MKYIDAEKLKTEIEKWSDGKLTLSLLTEIKRIISSLQQEPRFPQYDNIIDKVFGAGNLEGFEYNEAEMLVALAKEELLKSLQQKQPDYKEAVQLVFEEELTPFKDGNQWCFLLGRNLQDGICGFGDTILDAAVDFYKDYMNTKINIGELKISMARQEQPEVDLEKDAVSYCYDNGINITPRQAKGIALYFYERGLNARKEE